MRAWYLLALPVSQAVPSNRTIDDQYGDPELNIFPQFSPDNGWAQGATCNSCAAQPDVALAFDNTWHDATHHPGDPEGRTVSISFNGTAVYAYCIMANYINPGITTLTNLSITLDGGDAGTFVHVPSNSTEFEYNVPVYVNQNLGDASPHQLVLSANSEVNASLFLFDYLIYTIDTDNITTQDVGGSTTFSARFPSSTTKLTSSTSVASQPIELRSNSLPIGAIVGGVIGGLALVILLVLVLVFLRRRRLQPRHEEDDIAYQIEPFIHQDSSSFVPSSIVAPPTKSHNPEGQLERTERAPGVGRTSSRSDTSGSNTLVQPSREATADSTQSGSLLPSSGTRVVRTAAPANPGTSSRPQRKGKARDRGRTERLVKQVHHMREQLAEMYPAAEDASLRPQFSPSTAVSDSRLNFISETQAGSGSAEGLSREDELRTQIVVLLGKIERLREQRERGRGQMGRDAPAGIPA
ncbi:hypothetical protein EW146_g6058 [Bondarzewia mesenterica]|uniref:Mid2 domain-containing protein n=1 Tax=Bondarzewia mesenterica TaxID=1095465 RepID=A0A4S4LQQ0_9AGAM|nr:hypothetical protein EW146_g6058 [Bondarzewia mesenterica]